MLISTRPSPEAHLRRTLALPNVTLVAGGAEGLMFDGDRATGARYVPDGRAESVTVPADIAERARVLTDVITYHLGDSGRRTTTCCAAFRPAG